MTPPPAPNPRRQDVVISYAREDSDLVTELCMVLRHGGVERIYRYETPPRVQHSEAIAEDWRLACAGDPGPFFIVVYSEAYTESKICGEEYEYLIDLVFGPAPTAAPLRLGVVAGGGTATALLRALRFFRRPPAGRDLGAQLRPWLLIRDGPRPRPYGRFTADEHSYLDGRNGGSEVDCDHVVRNLIAKIRRTRPEILRHDRRDFVLEYWNRPAFERWPKGLQSLRLEDDPREVELIESNIGLAASLGLGQQFARAMAVASHLKRLFVEAERLNTGLVPAQLRRRPNGRRGRLRPRASGDPVPDQPLPEPGSLPRITGDLLSVFTHGARQYDGEVTDTQDELFERLEKYLTYHTPRMLEAVGLFVRALKDLSDTDGAVWESYDGLVKQVRILRGKSLELSDELTIGLARVAESHARVDAPGDNLVFGLRRFSASLTGRLRKRVGGSA